MADAQSAVRKAIEIVPGIPCEREAASPCNSRASFPGTNGQRRSATRLRRLLPPAIRTTAARTTSIGLRRLNDWSPKKASRRPRRCSATSSLSDLADYTRRGVF